MLNVVVPDTIQKLKKQIKALEYQIKNDINEKDRAIHQEVLKVFLEEVKEMDSNKKETPEVEAQECLTLKSLKNIPDGKVRLEDYFLALENEIDDLKSEICEIKAILSSSTLK